MVELRDGSGTARSTRVMQNETVEDAGHSVPTVGSSVLQQRAQPAAAACAAAACREP